MQTIEERFWEVDWHQGDIVDSGQTNALLDASIDERPSTTKNCVLCVISQDCDIIASTDKEPYIELLAGTINPTVCREFADLKSPRKIDIPTKDQTIRFSINDRFRVRKKSFYDLKKDEFVQLDEKSRSILRLWLARRYVRAAFPDAFNRRLKNNKKLQRFSQDGLPRGVFSIWIEVTDTELEDVDPYKISIIVGIDDDLSEQMALEIECLFDQAFSSSTGIVVENIPCATKDDITLRNLETHRILAEDSLSLSESTSA
ncbi:MAG: hypothetical protein BWX81_02292 [Spirochaetes bacterium ADurb.Bin110]|jgi:hypothetical protein|nr:MAG: hypothetical protein BWX81_02292 [Spirochaetes bacterium ADurb.Bin110]HPN02927.1 hypothetical protein [Rectinema sp.]